MFTDGFTSGDYRLAYQMPMQQLESGGTVESPTEDVGTNKSNLELLSELLSSYEDLDLKLNNPDTELSQRYISMRRQMDSIPDRIASLLQEMSYNELRTALERLEESFDDHQLLDILQQIDTRNLKDPLSNKLIFSKSSKLLSSEDLKEANPFFTKPTVIGQKELTINDMDIVPVPNENDYQQVNGVIDASKPDKIYVNHTLHTMDDDAIRDLSIYLAKVATSTNSSSRVLIEVFEQIEDNMALMYNIFNTVCQNQDIDGQPIFDQEELPEILVNLIRQINLAVSEDHDDKDCSTLARLFMYSDQIDGGELRDTFNDAMDQVITGGRSTQSYDMSIYAHNFKYGVNLETMNIQSELGLYSAGSSLVLEPREYSEYDVNINLTHAFTMAYESLNAGTMKDKPQSSFADAPFSQTKPLSRFDYCSATDRPGLIRQDLEVEYQEFIDSLFDIEGENYVLKSDYLSILAEMGYERNEETEFMFNNLDEIYHLQRELEISVEDFSGPIDLQKVDFIANRIVSSGNLLILEQIENQDWKVAILESVFLKSGVSRDVMDSFEARFDELMQDYSLSSDDTEQLVNFIIENTDRNDSLVFDQYVRVLVNSLAQSSLVTEKNQDGIKEHASQMGRLFEGLKGLPFFRQAAVSVIEAMIRTGEVPQMAVKALSAMLNLSEEEITYILEMVAQSISNTGMSAEEIYSDLSGVVTMSINNSFRSMNAEEKNEEIQNLSNINQSLEGVLAGFANAEKSGSEEVLTDALEALKDLMGDLPALKRRRDELSRIPADKRTEAEKRELELLIEIIPGIEEAQAKAAELSKDERFANVDFSGIVKATSSDFDGTKLLDNKVKDLTEDEVSYSQDFFRNYYTGTTDNIYTRFSEMIRKDLEEFQQVVRTLEESNNLDKEVEQRIERIREFNQQIEEFVQGQIEANQQQIEQFLNNYRLQITEMIDYLIKDDITIDETDKANLIQKLSYFQEMYLDAILGPRNKIEV